jgi:hypothetical protein
MSLKCHEDCQNDRQRDHGNRGPGPWKVALFEHEPNEAFVQWRAGFAAVHGSRAGREANAILIAAAPDLLMALQMLYDETADYIRLNNLGGMDNQCMQLARAALMRAQERSS